MPATLGKPSANISLYVVLLHADLIHSPSLLCVSLLQVKMSGAGHQATLVFKQSMTYFEPLYERLKKRQLEDELKVRAIGSGACFLSTREQQ